MTQMRGALLNSGERGSGEQRVQQSLRHLLLLLLLLFQGMFTALLLKEELEGGYRLQRPAKKLFLFVFSSPISSWNFGGSATESSKVEAACEHATIRGKSEKFLQDLLFAQSEIHCHSSCSVLNITFCTFCFSHCVCVWVLK